MQFLQSLSLACSVTIQLLPLANAAAVFTAEMPTLAVEFSSGQRVRATLDPKTNSERLWVRFGSDSTVIRRGFDWQTVQAVRIGDRTISKRDLIQAAASARQPEDASSTRQAITVPGIDARGSVPPRSMTSSPSDLPGNSPGNSPPSRVSAARIAYVDFDAGVENWDSDVEMDGLNVYVRPVGEDGNPVAARGMLTVELFSIHRVEPDDIPHGRGRDFRRVGQWTIAVTCASDGSGGWVHLPFQAAHPEFDVDWAPYGLVHIQFAAAGHDVFRRSLDGLRIRPYSPFRDALQQNSGMRFLPSEVR